MMIRAEEEIRSRKTALASEDENLAAFLYKIDWAHCCRGAS